jgi:hypothetical protein
MASGHRVKRAGAALLAVFLLLRATAVVGQQDDPSEIFLKAYLSAQQGENLEHGNRFKRALAKYRFAGSLIETLRRSHADWQPAIVEYRGRKISEGILRIQQRMTSQNELSVSSSPLPEVVPALPESETWSEPGPEVVAPQGGENITQVSRDAGVKEATRKLRDKVDQLQAAEPREQKRKISTPVLRKRIPSSKKHRTTSTKRANQNTRHMINSRRHRNR